MKAQLRDNWFHWLWNLKKIFLLSSFDRKSNCRNILNMKQLLKFPITCTRWHHLHSWQKGKLWICYQILGLIFHFQFYCWEQTKKLRHCSSPEWKPDTQREKNLKLSKLLTKLILMDFSSLRMIKLFETFAFSSVVYRSSFCLSEWNCANWRNRDEYGKHNNAKQTNVTWSHLLVR